METLNVNNLINFCVVVSKSKKGKEYKALQVHFLDKEENVVVAKHIDFLTDTQYNTIVSLLKK